MPTKRRFHTNTCRSCGDGFLGRNGARYCTACRHIGINAELLSTLKAVTAFWARALDSRPSAKASAADLKRAETLGARAADVITRAEAA